MLFCDLTYSSSFYCFFRSPDSALSSGLDKNTKFTPIGPMLWKGFVYMQDVSKFVTTAYRVTGPVHNLVGVLEYLHTILIPFKVVILIFR